MGKKKKKKNIIPDENNRELVSLDSINPFKRYLYEANRYPLLSEEEEKNLTVEYYRNHDPEIAKKIALSNLRLVVKIAMEYYYKVFCNLTDLIQEGNIGLLLAVTKFNPSKGIRFASYAQFWIRAYMLKYLLDSYSLVKIGTTRKQKKVFYNLGKAREAIENQGFKAETKLLAEYMNVKDKDVMIVESRMQNRDVSIDAPLAEDSTKTVQDIITQPPVFETDLEKRDLQIRVARKMKEFHDKLGEKEKYIWDNRLIPENKMTLQEVATQFGISKERVRQVEERLIKKLKKYWEENATNISISDIISSS